MMTPTCKIDENKQVYPKIKNILYIPVIVFEFSVSKKSGIFLSQWRIDRRPGLSIYGLAREARVIITQIPLFFWNRNLDFLAILVWLK